MTVEGLLIESNFDARMPSVDEVTRIIAKEKSQQKSVGLVTGCFDVLNIDHIRLFKVAKEYVDFLVVGIEQDKTITISKGTNRPFFVLGERYENLSALRSVDLVFSINFVVRYNQSERNNKKYERLYKELGPDFIITNIEADDYFADKNQRAANLGIGFLGFRLPDITSSSDIAKKIRKEF